jgi:hypothetical protein
MTYPRTLQNSTASPLLRLPAEIRNQIWRYAFGDVRLHHGQAMRCGYSRPVNCYNICSSDQTPSQLYHAIYRDVPAASKATPDPDSDADSDSDDEPTRDTEEDADKENNKKKEELSWEYACNSHHSSELQTFQRYMHVPLVCKHIFHEARAVFWSTSTFGVTRVFLSDWSSTDNKAIKSKIHNLEICMEGTDFSEALVSASASVLATKRCCLAALMSCATPAFFQIFSFSTFALALNQFS